MKSTLSSLSLLGLTLAAALPQNSPVRTLPPNWSFTITSLSGPGCPDFGADPNVRRSTRLTYGQNTMDGSEIYYWFVAYPYMRVNLTGTTHTWCETTLEYKELADLDGKKEGEDYRLRLHKNGTAVIGTYELEEGVKATWSFEYEKGGRGRDITDTVTISGPAASGKYDNQLHSESMPNSKPVLAPLPDCGSGEIKFRTDLRIEGKKGKKGYVQSETSVDKQGKVDYYGAQQGFSYDWVKCEN
ncbi:hypothetical protein BCR34DRAFT_487655 [Clohesyomyces aquaticus]|uniref:Uncharacterized protein n=1 Tax=Clohesyomyces aquaticus TaxID=1231657 RepID=A0A1Y1ZG62_9PLEO|nr:hypothetical protein BCR34DRAFT_487655 [Clohesyomyces aquaticus]